MNKGFIIPMLALSLAIGGTGVGYGIYTKNNTYTKEEYDAHYQEGYDIGCKDSVVLKNQINSYIAKIKELTAEINSLSDTNTLSSAKINQLESEKQSLQFRVDELIQINSENETTIANNNAEISRLKNQVTILQASDENKTAQITSLNNQISSLQTINSQLQKTNDLNSVTITNLNNQVVNLNKQISDLSNQMQDNNNNVVVLQSRINDLEKSVAYYEQYISTLENGEQVVATFEFNGSVYNVQVVNKGDIITLTNPTSSESVIFNYWMVDGEQVDLATYPINESTKFVANVTKKYQAKFMVDSEEYNSQFVTTEESITIPDNPTKDGYEFDGWSTNGVDIINVETELTQDVTYYAVFTKLHTITFIVDGNVYTTQTVRNGEYGEVVTPTKDGYIFDGWTTDGETIVDVSTQSIISNVTYIAKFSVGYGLYDIETNALLYTFDELISQNYLTLSSGTLKANDSFTTLRGRFKVSNDVVSIWNGFEECSIDELVLSDSVVYIGFEQFKTCPNLKSIYFGSSFKELSHSSVGGYQFTKCPLLNSIEVSNENPYYCDMGNSLVYKSNNYLAKGFICSELVESIVGIADYAYQYSEWLTEIEIPTNITSLGKKAFSNCVNLSSVKLCDGLKTIGAWAFESSALTSLYIPSSVETILSTSEYDGILYLVKTNPVIYLGHSEVPVGFESHWNYYGSSNKKFEYKLGYTYEQYLEEINS